MEEDHPFDAEDSNSFSKQTGERLMERYSMTTLSTKLTFQLAYAGSLKDKRMVSRSLIDKTRKKYNASVSEVDTQQSHRILTLGVAVVSGEHSHARNMLDDIIRFMERNTDAELISVTEE